MFGYNATLCVYYACAIAFKMREDKIVKWVEPILHIVPLVVGLGYAIPPFFTKMYNATGKKEHTHSLTHSLGSFPLLLVLFKICEGVKITDLIFFFLCFAQL